MASYLVKPRASLDLDNYVDYLLREVNVETALRFLEEAHSTFSILATQPGMGWRSRTKYPGLESLRVFRLSRFRRMLVLYRPLTPRIEILRVIHGSRSLRSLLRREGLE